MTDDAGQYNFRRATCYAAGVVENPLASAAMSAHYVELSTLMTDDLTCEVFQLTYLRITRRYHGGDFVKLFRYMFYNTLREFCKREDYYKSTHHALPEEM